MKILLIDNYDSFTYNLYHYISNFKKNVDVIRNNKIDGKTILRNKYDKIVYEPFCIFEKNNFLENSFYQNLKENFPEEKSLWVYIKMEKKFF